LSKLLLHIADVTSGGSYPSSCSDAKKRGLSTGIIKIRPHGSTAFDVS